MASFSSLALTVLNICVFKVQKTGHFFFFFFFSMKTQKVVTKSLIFEFSELVFKYLFFQYLLNHQAKIVY